MAERKRISIAVAKLFVDYLTHLRQTRALYEECKEKEGFSNQTCCQPHKLLKEQFEALKKRAETLKINHSPCDGTVFSALWWEAQGFLLGKYAEVIN